VTVCYLRDSRDPLFNVTARGAALGADYLELLERHSFDLRVWTQLRRLVQSRRIDIVHSHDYKTDVLARLLAASDGVIPLATAHGWTGSSARERYLYYPADKRVLRGFPLTIAVSDEIRCELVRRGVPRERIRLILNGIDHRAARRDPRRAASARAQFGLRRTDLVIGGVGRLEHQKRFDLLIRACAELHQTWPHVQLVIAGEGSLRGELEALATELLPAGTWRLLGHVDDVGALHHAMDIFVQSSDYEGTPNAVLEAMAFETPIVATTAGGTAELIDDGVHALTVPCGDLDSLQAAIDAALIYREATSARVNAARLAVETRLSFDARTAALDAVYAELVARRVESKAA
jgi:glycosyltransferase involved in cell wall biosynthesis